MGRSGFVQAEWRHLAAGAVAAIFVAVLSATQEACHFEAAYWGKLLKEQAWGAYVWLVGVCFVPDPLPKSPPQD